jgi:ribosomal protein S1
MKKNTGKCLAEYFKVTAAIALISLCSIGTQAQDTKGQAVMSSETVTATVLKVNQKTREVTIKTKDGKEHTFVAGDNVKNLAQVKKGDIITAVYTEAIAYEVKKHGTAGVQTTTAAASAKPGEKPAGGVAQQTTVTVTITAIDKKAETVTFMGPRGNKETVKVRDPKNLNGVKIGDMVDITYTEALAIRVDEAPKK